MKTGFTLSSATLVQTGGENIERPIAHAVSILKRDMEKILRPRAAGENTIRIPAPDTSLPAESWIIEVTPEEIHIRYGDSLGCVYALLFISGNFLGVTPFWFWNDQRFVTHDAINIPVGVWRSPPHAVRFRGWFVNDEVLIQNWRGEPEHTEHWALIFETLLRCGGNMTIPGTDCNSRKYRGLAADMGLWITHHHAEPLGAEMFLRAYPGKTPSFTVNYRLFEQLWEQAVLEQQKYRVLWNLGFRGQGDRPFWEDDPACASASRRGEIISEVILRQYEIVRRYVDNPVCCINLYGEITGLYREGYLRLPPGIIKIWADNGYGRMVSRRQHNSNPRVPSLPSPEDSPNNQGPHGIYYHCSFHDLQASNHLTMSPNPAEFLAAELGKALDARADEYWIINCGSVKPHVHTLDLAGELWRAGNIDVDTWRVRYAAAYFGKNQAERIAALFRDYAACTAPYGPNEDDRAGEQLWHHPVRELLCRWIAGDAKTCVETLIWLTGEVDFPEQAAILEKICLAAIPRWKNFYEQCAAIAPALDADSLRLFNDTLVLQARLHLNGAAGAAAFCASFRAYAARSPAQSFCLAEQSRAWYEASFRALMEAEHDHWDGYYRGDCLTDIRLTASSLNALVSYIRVAGDGPDFHTWEKEFLAPRPERDIMLLSSKQRALTNDELAARLSAKTATGNSLPLVTAQTGVLVNPSLSKQFGKCPRVEDPEKTSKGLEKSWKN